MPDQHNSISSSLYSALERHGQIKTISLPRMQGELVLIYFEELTDLKLIRRHITEPLQELLQSDLPLEALIHHIPLEQQGPVKQRSAIIEHLIAGWTYVYGIHEPDGYLFNTRKSIQRSPSKPEVESQIMGPQIAFTESLETNRALLRQYLPDPNLRFETFRIGEHTRTEVQLLYMEGKAREADVKLLKERLSKVNEDGITDTSMLLQSIDDDPRSLFPQMVPSERLDRVILNLTGGKLVVMMDGTPSALISPSPFFDFFKSAEDDYLRRNMAMFLRLLRTLAIFISVFFTPMYVAALTYHYQLIPSNMLVPLAQSRSKVPFPPLMEALLLEFIIELLREAGARLPTKVGQTMGIVGGIVIGQAAVQAGFTSNILIIIVALAALSSFITPVYLMGAAIRILRFPMLLLAGWLGAVGIMIGVSFLILHLLRLSTIGHSYMYPLYPMNLGMMKKSKRAWQKRTTQDIFEEPAGDRT
ncbi:spore germination protein [Paenibacillus allorhizosphaerae]|uniref:Spore germination protein A1 n=1 Tax=Paenibacillus allorhizosphaerae TaxID=2849866 RepID=A0ABM8VEF4_9BACL|nr:spore germination protein [Paenibacillus allorhizosphaerae]CAG7631126.1 Spore germination protein A1 [Paenibacillus allorhizosphaerae]